MGVETGGDAFEGVPAARRLGRTLRRHRRLRIGLIQLAYVVGGIALGLALPHRGRHQRIVLEHHFRDLTPAARRLERQVHVPGDGVAGICRGADGLVARARRAEWHCMFTATGFIVMCVAAVSTCTAKDVESPPRPCGPTPS